MRLSGPNRIERLAVGVVAGWAALAVGADAPAASQNLAYDEVGRASWYGHELAGRRTSNGERFNPRGISAAHRLLPFDSFAEVTSLESGRIILVRINDRGPVSRRRILDLSLGAARQLGVERHGEFAVRVRRVDPPQSEKAALRKGLPAAERAPAPPTLLRALRRQLSGESGSGAGSLIQENEAAEALGPAPAKGYPDARFTG